jgi:probable rRNA maturation factor
MNNKNSDDDLSISANNCTDIAIEFDVALFAKDVAKEKNILSGSIDITIINDYEMIKIHKKYLKKSSITDIITFNLGTQECPIGDIYICGNQAIKNAKMFNNSVKKEFQLLIVHGILHILDYKDYTIEEKKEMEIEQNRILKKIT